MTPEGGSLWKGIIFEYDISSGIETKLYDFGNGTDGKSPNGSLIQAKDNLLYGMTYNGGINDSGTLFSYDISTGIETDLYDFGNGTDGFNPEGSLIQAGNGLLYGMTLYGGTNGISYYQGGIIFSYDISTGAESDLHDFGNGTDGNIPYGSIIQASDSNLYGMTQGGGINREGMLFSYNISTGLETDVHDFSDSADGNLPRGSLIQASDGFLYGMTQYGGVNNSGIIFSCNLLSGNEIDVHDFGNGTDGQFPFGTLFQANNGFLYGMTWEGGATYQGLIFSYDISSDSESDIHDFGAGTCYTPNGSLMRASDSLIYGMTFEGGKTDNGAIFNYNISTRVETELYDFNNGLSSNYVPNGHPYYMHYGSFIQATDGLLYGMTVYGGLDSTGVLFSYNTSTGVETDLHDFGSGSDGKSPYGSLLQASDGLLYGMTAFGGLYNKGTIFRYNISTGAETVLYNFLGFYGVPFGSLIQANDGLLYGMTSGNGEIGNIFSYNISTSTYTDVFDFNGTEGAVPYGSLLQASDGLLYGMTSQGGVNDSGTIFEYNISSGILTDIYDFRGDSDGGFPFGSFIQASNGLLYGTATSSLEGTPGGNTGIIFSYNISTGTKNNIHHFTGLYEGTPLGDLLEVDNNTTTVISQPPLNNNHLLLYPNPTNYEVNVVSGKTIDDIKVTNLFGQIIYESQPKQSRFTFNVKEPGMYFVTVNENDEVLTKKLTVSH